MVEESVQEQTGSTQAAKQLKIHSDEVGALIGSLSNFPVNEDVQIDAMRPIAMDFVSVPFNDFRLDGQPHEAPLPRIMVAFGQMYLEYHFPALKAGTVGTAYGAKLTDAQAEDPAGEDASAFSYQGLEDLVYGSGAALPDNWVCWCNGAPLKAGKLVKGKLGSGPIYNASAQFSYMFERSRPDHSGTAYAALQGLYDTQAECIAASSVNQTYFVPLLNHTYPALNNKAGLGKHHLQPTAPKHFYTVEVTTAKLGDLLQYQKAATGATQYHPCQRVNASDVVGLTDKAVTCDLFSQVAVMTDDEQGLYEDGNYIQNFFSCIELPMAVGANEEIRTMADTKLMLAALRSKKAAANNFDFHYLGAAGEIPFSTITLQTNYKDRMKFTGPEAMCVQQVLGMRPVPGVAAFGFDQEILADLGRPSANALSLGQYEKKDARAEIKAAYAAADFELLWLVVSQMTTFMSNGGIAIQGAM